MRSTIIKFIDNANRVLLFIAAIIVIIAIGKDILRDIFRESYSEPSVQVVEKSHDSSIQKKPNFEKRYIGKIRDAFIIEVTSDMVFVEEQNVYNTAMIDYSSPFTLSSNAVNMIISKVEGKKTKLFKENLLISGFYPIRSNETDRTFDLSKNIFLVVKQDTNSDGFLNSKDKKELLISDYDGSNLMSVISNISTHRIIDNDVILLNIDSELYVFNVHTGDLNKIDTSFE